MRIWDGICVYIGWHTRIWDVIRVYRMSYKRRRIASRREMSYAYMGWHTRIWDVIQKAYDSLSSRGVTSFVRYLFFEFFLEPLLSFVEPFFAPFGALLSAFCEGF